MKKCLLLLPFISLFTACSKTDEPSGGKMENAPLTVMAYFVADANGIEDDIYTNVAAMYDGLALMKKPATLLVYWDGSGSYGNWDYPVVLRYKTDGKGNINGQKQLPEEATVLTLILGRGRSQVRDLTSEAAELAADLDARATTL